MNKSTVLLSATFFGFVGGYAPVLFGSSDLLLSVLSGMVGGFFGIWLGVWLGSRL